MLVLRSVRIEETHTRVVHCRSWQAKGAVLAHSAHPDSEHLFSSPSLFASGFERPLAFGAACVVGRQGSWDPRVQGLRREVDDDGCHSTTEVLIASS